MLLQNRYQIIRRLGHPETGQTWLAMDTLSSPESPCVIACRPDPSQSARETLARILRTLGEHPQFPALLDFFDHQGQVYWVQEWIVGRTLASLLAQDGCFSALRVQQILEEALPLLDRIHSHQVIHGTISLTSLIDRPSFQSRDPVSSLVLVGCRACPASPPWPDRPSYPGHPEYAAPEQLQGSPTFASDLYSLGMVCVQLLTDLHPFELIDRMDGKLEWRSYWLPREGEADDLRDRLGQLLDQMVTPLLSQRFRSATEVLQAMQRLGLRQISFKGNLPIPTPGPVVADQEARWVCIATLTGHDGLFRAVNGVALSPDGQTIASGGDDRTIHLWNWQGECLGILEGHTGFVKTVAFHPNGELLVSGGADRMIKLWDWRSRQEVCSLQGHQHSVNTVQFSPDGTRLVSGSADKTAQFWNWQSGEPGISLKGHTLGITDLAFSPDGEVLASVSLDRTIRLWQVQTGQSISILKEHTRSVRAVAFSPDGEWLASGGDDNLIYIWDWATGQRVRTISGHSWAVVALAFTTDGKGLISGSWDRILKVWQVETGRLMTILTGHHDDIYGLAIGPEGKTIASCGKDQTVKLWAFQN